MSNLLKKSADAGVVPFGFPEIGHGEPAQDADAVEIVPTVVEEVAEPEESLEEVYRRKLLELERRAQEIEKEAYGKGFTQGEKDGFEYGHKAIQVVKTQLERIAEGMDSLPGQILSDYRQWLIETSLKIARRIVDRELEVHPEIVAGFVGELLDEAEEHSALVVYLHPQDVELMGKKAQLDLMAGRKHFALKADRDLERGGCRLESPVQYLDGSLATRFENLKQYLLGGGESDSPAEADDAE